MTIDELVKAADSLKVAQTLLGDAKKTSPDNLELHRALRDAAIQRFEFCVELSWKVSMKILGLQAKAPNPAIRDMAQNGLIDDPSIWFDFLRARNKTSHTYDEDVAREVYKEVERLEPELNKLIAKLKNMP